MIMKKDAKKRSLVRRYRCINTSLFILLGVKAYLWYLTVF